MHLAQPVLHAAGLRAKDRLTESCPAHKESIHSGSGSACSSFITNGAGNTLSVTKRGRMQQVLGVKNVCAHEPGAIADDGIPFSYPHIIIH